MTGTVFDIGYQRYTGEREGRARGRAAVFKDGVRIALGLGRGNRAKLLAAAFFALIVGMGLIIMLVTGAVERLNGPEANEVYYQAHYNFYGFASIPLFLFAALIAPELLCRDRREGTINLYLVRPLTATDYVVARWAAFLAVTLVLAWLPQAILFTGFMLDAPAPLAYLRDHWLVIPRILAAGLAMAVYVTTLAMLAAAFTTRRAYASVVLVGLFVISTPFTVGIASQVGGTVGAWIAMFNLTAIPVHVNDIIFGKVGELLRSSPALELHSAVRVGWLVAWVVVPGAILLTRYRRLAP